MGERNIMIKHYRWKPDTCECSVNETHDPETNEWGAEETYTNPRGEVFNTVRCAAHSSILDANVLYGVLHKNPDGENKRKNQVERLLLGHDSIKNLGLEQINADGAVVFKNGVDMNWSFTGTGASRVLRISVSGVTLTTQQKNAIKSFADTKFGVGKTEIV